jgi:hypothetical protein
MLSWSGNALQLEVDVDSIGTGDGDAGVPFGAELIAFAEAIAGFDDAQLVATRAALVAATSIEFMIDAAAVAANFEMMTRVADGTGARFPDASALARETMGARLGVTQRTY